MQEVNTMLTQALSLNNFPYSLLKLYIDNNLSKLPLNVKKHELPEYLSGLLPILENDHNYGTRNEADFRIT